MMLVQNYLNFMDIHDLTEEQSRIIRVDFCVSLMNTLKILGCNDWLLGNIPDVLFHAMVNEKVHYHTPAHIMAVFNFAQRHEININAEEELAIFFHDAIYRAGSEQNESLSVDFMNALLTNTGIHFEVLNRVGMIIAATKLHLREDKYPKYMSQVMDLDMSGFAADPKSFDLQNVLIEREFYNPSMSGYSDLTLDKFLDGRMKFLQTLKAKKSIYRTGRFEEFEPFAQVNLQRTINATQKRIDDLAEDTRRRNVLNKW